MALDLNKTFCTAITEPERYASYDFTTTSTPTEVQVEEYCYDVAALIVFQTERAGLRHTPPASGITDTYLARVLTQANAVGAAYLARHHIYTYNGDKTSHDVMQRLAGLWQMYMGEGSLSIGAGVPTLQIGSGGVVGQLVESASNSRLLANDATTGDISLGTIDQVTNVTPPFKMSTVD